MSTFDVPSIANTDNSQNHSPWHSIAEPARDSGSGPSSDVLDTHASRPPNMMGPAAKAADAAPLLAHWAEPGGNISARTSNAPQDGQPVGTLAQGAQNAPSEIALIPFDRAPKSSPGERCVASPKPGLYRAPKIVRRAHLQSIVATAIAGA